jgi:putative membrane protein
LASSGPDQPIAATARRPAPELSVWFGAALIAIGAIVNLFSAQRFMHLVGELNRDQFADRSLSRQRVIVALFLAMLGIAMTIYLTFFLTQPLHGLHATVAGIAISK